MNYNNKKIYEKMCNMKIQGDALDVTFEPLAGFGLTNLLRITAHNKFNISTRYMPRLLYSFLLSSVLTPFRFRETLKYRTIIDKTKITKSPLFIIGHWRSGTTYLHNLMTLNQNYGYCSTFHTTAPNVFLANEKIIKPIVSASLPKKRPQDDVALGADLPQEEEYGLGALFPYAYYNGWCFPKNMKFYNKFVCLVDIPDRILKNWKNNYLYFLKKVTIYNKDKRLILKNPANTGRIKLLLEMFPDAQFVHIIRNPYEVYHSMIRFMEVIMSKYCVQVPPDDLIEVMMDLYNQMYDKYFSERDLIPSENLTEIKYENVINNPVDNIKKIHNNFNLSGYNKHEEKLKKYVDSQKQTKLSKYSMDENVKEMIYKKWKRIFEEFEYSV